MLWTVPLAVVWLSEDKEHISHEEQLDDDGDRDHGRRRWDQANPNAGLQWMATQLVIATLHFITMHNFTLVFGEFF